MTNHPITPPPELVRQWCEHLFGCPDEPEVNAYELARPAAQYGADAELGACCEWLTKKGYCVASDRLRAVRRPKPASLKQQALEQLNSIQALLDAHDLRSDDIRRALEQLDD